MVDLFGVLCFVNCVFVKCVDVSVFQFEFVWCVLVVNIVIVLIIVLVFNVQIDMIEWFVVFVNDQVYDVECCYVFGLVLCGDVLNVW